MSGVMGINMDKRCWPDLIAGMPLLQHRGDEWGGFAVIEDSMIQGGTIKGKITSLLEKEDPRIEKAQMTIAHVSQKNPQPVIIEETRMGPIALAFDGKIINKEEIRERSPYLVGTDAEILARIVAGGRDPLNGIESLYHIVKGPFSLLLLSPDGIFVSRDILGVRPFVLGRFFGNSTVGCAVASESIALEHIGMTMIRDVRPGEIINVEPSGFKTLKKMPGLGTKFCSFEYGYWARPSSIIEGIPVGLARYNAGVKLASSCPAADIVASFPMSGNTAAEGFHFASGIPYRSIYDFNIEAGGRSFLPFSPEQRLKRARRKLLIMSWAVKDTRIVIVDDSIVEGNQILARIHLVNEAGAKEVHLRIEAPMMKFPCPFDITPRGQLFAAKYSEEEMRKILGVRSLVFNTVENFAEAIISVQDPIAREKNPISIESLCLGCFTGEFPKYD